MKNTGGTFIVYVRVWNPRENKKKKKKKTQIIDECF
jgi:hypothetical protein